MRLFLFNLPAIICFCIAGYLCYRQQDGWGWFLFVGLMATSCCK